MRTRDDERGRVAIEEAVDPESCFALQDLDAGCCSCGSGGTGSRSRWIYSGSNIKRGSGISTVL